MKRFLFVLPLFFFFLLSTQVPATEAQVRPTPTNIPTNSPVTSSTSQQSDDNKGSIRGAVYDDTSLDGKCTVEDDTPIANVPVTFSQGGIEAVTLKTGDNGTYGIVAIVFGEWDVSITAPDGYSVVGADVLSVNVVGGGHDSETVTDVNFCITQGDAKSSTNNNTNTGVLLPQAGAETPVSNGRALLIWVAMAGLMFIGVGMAMEARRRQTAETID